MCDVFVVGICWHVWCLHTSVEVCRETRAGHHVSSSAMLHFIALRLDVSLYQKLVI